MKDSPTTAGSSSNFSKKPLGEILIEAGLIPIHQLELALQEQKQTGMRVGEILVLHGWIKQETVDFFADKWTKFIEEKDKKPLIYYFQQAGLLNDEQVKAIAATKNQVLDTTVQVNCVAQSALQTASCSGRKSERFNLTQENELTIGQRLYTLTREALHNLLELNQSLLLQGKSTEQILEVMMAS